jgi:hypothetical protein
MRFISTRVHGMLDYVVGVLLILLPRLFGFQTGGYDEKIPVILGVAAIVYSLITRYELGLFKVLPFKLHLTFDFLSGVLLALSPWLFGFADRVWAPHFAIGLFEIAAALLTVPHSAHELLRAWR